MTERRLFPAGTVPEYATAEWYVDRDAVAHVDEALHRPRLERAAALAAELSADTIVDIGAGDGGFLELVGLPAGVTGAYGFDLCPANVAAAARRGVTVTLADAVELIELELVIPASRAVVIATETIEHLLDPHSVLRALAETPGVVGLVASSPWTETEGSAYPFHLWAWDEAGYVELLEAAGWRVTAQHREGMFTVVAAMKADR